MKKWWDEIGKIACYWKGVVEHQTCSVDGYKLVSGFLGVLEVKVTDFPETFIKLSTMIVMGRARTRTPETIAPLAISLPAKKF